MHKSGIGRAFSLRWAGLAEHSAQLHNQHPHVATYPQVHLCVTKVTGSGGDSIFMGVTRVRGEGESPYMRQPSVHGLSGHYLMPVTWPVTWPLCSAAMTCHLLHLLLLHNCQAVEKEPSVAKAWVLGNGQVMCVDEVGTEREWGASVCLFVPEPMQHKLHMCLTWMQGLFAAL